MAEKKKFPNPQFFRARNNMDWKKQAENLKEFGSIALDLLKETDWKAFAAKQKDHLLDNVARVTREAKTIAAMTGAERMDLLKNGEKHDGRAPDYDDWHLNGDILVYNRVTDAAFELSSMGIRVDADSLVRQLTAENMLERLELPFHKALAAGELPLSIGGGIGQSRLCMLLLQKAHIGEVHASLWPESELARCREMGVELL